MYAVVLLSDNDGCLSNIWFPLSLMTSVVRRTKISSWLVLISDLLVSASSPPAGSIFNKKRSHERKRKRKRNTQNRKGRHIHEISDQPIDRPPTRSTHKRNTPRITVGRQRYKIHSISCDKTAAVHNVLQFYHRIRPVNRWAMEETAAYSLSGYLSLKPVGGKMIRDETCLLLRFSSSQLWVWWFQLVVIGVHSMKQSTHWISFIPNVTWLMIGENHWKRLASLDPPLVWVQRKNVSSSSCMCATLYAYVLIERRFFSEDEQQRVSSTSGEPRSTDGLVGGFTGNIVHVSSRCWSSFSCISGQTWC